MRAWLAGLVLPLALAALPAGAQGQKTDAEEQGADRLSHHGSFGLRVFRAAPGGSAPRRSAAGLKAFCLSV